SSSAFIAATSVAGIRPARSRLPGGSDHILPCSILNAPMTSPPVAPLTELTLPVVGMTCASCVNRIERFLSRSDGVADAAVSLATERATVHFDPRRIDRGGIVAA